MLAILQKNYLESSTEIVYDGKTIWELVNSVHDDLLAGRSVEGKLGALWSTKAMNSPYHFSIEFQLGTYLPFLSPLLIGLGQIIIARVKESIYGPNIPLTIQMKMKLE